MATTEEARGEDGRGLLVAGLVALAVVTGAAFGRVFRGSGPTLRLIAAGVAATLLAALLERRHLALSLLAGAAGLLVAVGLLVFPDSTAAGLPTLETFRAIGDALGRVGRQAIEEYAPAAAHPPLVMAALTGMWAACQAAHALASRAGGSVMALVPPAALLGFASLVTEDGARPVYALGFLAAAAVVLFGVAVRRLGTWGPILPLPRASPSRRLSAGGTVRGAQRLAVGASAVALVVPWFLPGFHGGPLWDIASSGRSGRVSINPIVDIRPSLRRNPPVELFRVRSPRATYWRLLALEEFNGRQWTDDDLGLTHRPPRDGTGPLQPVDVGLPAVDLAQEFRISGLATPWVPAAYEPVDLNLEGAIRYDESDGTIVRSKGLTSGLRYVVRSQLAVPQPRELDRAQRFDPAFDAISRTHTLLPAPVRSGVLDLARDITRGQRTTYRKVLAIQDYLRTFTYDEAVPAGHGIDDIQHFLRIRRGYCEQFSGTMAVLVRALGIPARVAVGFTPGDLGQDGAFRVTSQQAHAWTEVYFPGWGWLAFEPTPSRNNPAASAYQFPPLVTPPRSGVQSEAALTQFGGTQREQQERQRELAGLRGAGSEEQEAGASPWARALLAGAVLVLAAAFLLPGGKTATRRLRLAQARSPREAVLTAFQVFEAGAADVGLGRRAGETFWEYRARLRTAGLATGELDRLAGLAGRAAYSSRNVHSEEAEEARSAARLLARAVRRHVGLLRAYLGALRLRPRPAPL